MNSSNLFSVVLAPSASDPARELIKSVATSETTAVDMDEKLNSLQALLEQRTKYAERIAWGILGLFAFIFVLMGVLLSRDIDSSFWRLVVSFQALMALLLGILELKVLREKRRNETRQEVVRGFKLVRDRHLGR